MQQRLRSLKKGSCHFRISEEFPANFPANLHSYSFRHGANYGYGKKTDALHPESIRFPEMLKRSVPL